MQKVYLLLRSNKELGPFTLEELTALDLTPLDLIWVEGKSAGWRYPSEIDSLKRYTQAAEHPAASSTPATAPSISLSPISLPASTSRPASVHVTMPGKKLRIPSIGIQKTLIPPTPSHSSIPSVEMHNASIDFQQEPIKVNSRQSMEESENGYLDWVVKKQAQTKAHARRKNAIAIATLLVLVALASIVFFQTNTSSEVPIVQANSSSPVSPTPLPVDQSKNTNTELATIDQASETVLKEAASQKAVKPLIRVASNKSSTSSMSAVNKNGSVAKSSVPSEPVLTSESNKVLNEPSPEVSQGESKDGVTEKKKNKGILAGIFKKREHKTETQVKPVVEDIPRPSTNREAVKRNDEESSPSTPATEPLPDITSQVVLSSNVDENWMMGINDLKITINNKASVGIKTGVISIQYLDESNNVLDTKTIVASNIPAHGKVVVPGPSHKMASKVKLSLTRYEPKNSK